MILAKTIYARRDGNVSYNNEADLDGGENGSSQLLQVWDGGENGAAQDTFTLDSGIDEGGSFVFGIIVDAGQNGEAQTGDTFEGGEDGATQENIVLDGRNNGL